MMGAFGSALIFLVLLALLAIVGACYLSFAAFSFLVVVEGTAAGVDEVEWPDEPFVDRLARVLQLLWLASFWLVPVGILARVLAPVWLPEDPALRFLLPAAGCFWLLFPVSVLSSITASSRWVPFNPALLPRLVRCLPSLFLFYLVTAAFVAGCAALLYYATAGGILLLVPVAAAAWGTLLLVYARLLGRVGWLLGRVQLPERAPVEEPPPPTKATRPRPAPRPPEVNDPWAVPKEARRPRKKKAEPPPRLPVEGYGLAKEEAPPPAEPERPRPRPAPRATGYSMSKEEPPPRPKETPLDGYLPVGSRAVRPDPEDEDEDDEDSDPGEKSARPGTTSPPPAYPLWSGVYTFPWYATSLKAWLWLSLGALAILAVLGLMKTFFPGG